MATRSTTCLTRLRFKIATGLIGLLTVSAVAAQRERSGPERASPKSPAAGPATAPQTGPASPTSRPDESRKQTPFDTLAIADAPAIEREAIARQLADAAWPRRAIAAVRLERYGCSESRSKLLELLKDKSWQVRAFAIRTLARRGEPGNPEWFADEHEPRVLRTALRCGYSIDPDRLQRGVRILARSNAFEDKLLAADLGVVSGNDELKTIAAEAVKQVILRMSRTEAGAFSQRLAVLTGRTDLHTQYEWQNWLLKTGRRFQLKPPAPDAAKAGDRNEPSMLARLEPDQYGGLDSYMADLRDHPVDLAICLDCTASMSRVIAASQAGIDDMMRFVGDVVSSLRVGLVAYRDRGDEFETRPFDFDPDIRGVREHLFSLFADGGGDAPEAVYPAMSAALNKLSWRADSSKVLVVVGDAPPHVGYGAPCAGLAQRGREQAKLTTHMIEAAGKKVDHFEEIAKAGGGRCVPLADDDSLMAEITGLTLGDRYQDEFREFYRVYLELCR